MAKKDNLSYKVNSLYYAISEQRGMLAVNICYIEPTVSEQAVYWYFDSQMNLNAKDEKLQKFCTINKVGEGVYEYTFDAVPMSKDDFCYYVSPTALYKKVPYYKYTAIHKNVINGNDNGPIEVFVNFRDDQSKLILYRKHSDGVMTIRAKTNDPDCLLTSQIEEVNVFRIDDTSIFESFTNKFWGTGTLKVYCKDASDDYVNLIRIKNPSKVRNLVNELIEEDRRARNIQYGEMQF